MQACKCCMLGHGGPACWSRAASCQSGKSAAATLRHLHLGRAACLGPCPCLDRDPCHGPGLGHAPWGLHPGCCGWCQAWEHQLPPKHPSCRLPAHAPPLELSACWAPAGQRPQSCKGCWFRTRRVRHVGTHVEPAEFCSFCSNDRRLRTGKQKVAYSSSMPQFPRQQEQYRQSQKARAPTGDLQGGFYGGWPPIGLLDASAVSPALATVAYCSRGEAHGGQLGDEVVLLRLWHPWEDGLKVVLHSPSCFRPWASDLVGS